ncbi:MAG: DJ-1/PfpI family protein [Acidimicrobiales bacterium]
MRIVIPLFDRFTALDAVGPYEVLSRLPGAELIFVAETAGPVTADSGRLTLVAEEALAGVTTADVLVVPGGPGTRALIGAGPAKQGRPLLEWIAAIHPTTTWTASVCTGALLLAAAGVLDGLDATTHWASGDELASLGVPYTARRVVEHAEQGIITAAGVSAGIDMALTLAARLADPDTARALQLLIEYDPQPPFDSGSPAKAGPDIVARLRP